MASNVKWFVGHTPHQGERVVYAVMAPNSMSGAEAARRAVRQHLGIKKLNGNTWTGDSKLAGTMGFTGADAAVCVGGAA